MSFQRGVSPSSSYAGVSDAWLQEGLPSTNAGGDTLLRMDHDYPTDSRQSANALLRFDLRDIPPGATVRSVQLTLHVTNRTTGEGYFLYAAGREWNEFQATWSQATSTVRGALPAHVARPTGARRCWGRSSPPSRAPTP